MKHEGPAKELASFVLLVLMAGGFYTHYALNDSFERIAPSLIFGLLIICRLIILSQVIKKEKTEEEMLRKFLEENELTEEQLQQLKEQVNSKKDK